MSEHLPPRGNTETLTVANTHVPLDMQPDLRAAHVILEHLLDDMNVPPPPLQARQRLVDVRPRPLDDESAKAAEDVLEVGGAPDLGLAHGLDEVGAREQRYPRLDARRAVGGQHAALGERAVDLGLEVVEDLGGGDVVGLRSFLLDALPRGGGSVGGSTHADGLVGVDHYGGGVLDC